MKSLWTENIAMPHFPELQGDVSTDVLIIGGGMAGILCAMAVKRRNMDYLLVEAKNIGGGVTGGTTAVITPQHDTLYGKLISEFGAEKAKQYLDANLWAAGEFKRLAGIIPCDFEEKASVMYSRTDRAKMEREAETVRGLGFPAEFLSGTPLPFPIAGAVSFPGQGQFHPLKFIAGAAAGMNILENTFVRKIEGGRALTDKGAITAKKIIIATHFPFINSRGLYFMKLYQCRSYVIALENAGDFGATYVDEAEGGFYFRNFGGLLLVGGGDRRTGGKGGGYGPLRDFARRYFPDAGEKFAWAAQDCMSLDGAPYIGRYSPALENVYVLTGFNEWGMTTSMVGAEILAQSISGGHSEYEEVFRPDRSMLKKQLFANMGEALINYAVPTRRRCPHMGCALKWNGEEHTWECGCHGSRFDGNGALIDNPAMKDSGV